jgi:hypothetical protein
MDKLGAATESINLGTAKVHHLVDWHKMSHPERLKVLRSMVLARGRDPRIAKKAVEIFREKNVKPRDYEGQAAALLAWVQDPKHVYYVNEPGERLQDPIHTMEVGHGDCFAKGTLVLKKNMDLVPVEDIRPGDEIWGYDRWSIVLNAWGKGELPVTRITLNNGSAMRLTEGHKVYALVCCGPENKGHGVACAQKKTRKQCRDRYGFVAKRIDVRDLEPGMLLLQPKNISVSQETDQETTDLSWLVGAYIAEGWSEKSRIALSGLDGHWKEATKVRGKQIAESRGWACRWAAKYLSINSKEAVALVAGCGARAQEKTIPQRWLANGDLVALEEGLRLDASKNSRGEGWTFGTTSPRLALQYRVLQRCLGRSTSHREVKNHGGFGQNSIHRVGVRNPTRTEDRSLQVTSVEREVEVTHCFDIATDDNYVYLPEADCTVSNCDDQALLLTCLFESVGLPWKFVLSGVHAKTGEKIRYIEGTEVPPNVKWSHIYCMVGTPPFNPRKWFFCETTVIGVPLGWDVISGDRRFIPEMQKVDRTKPPMVYMPGPPKKGFRPAPVPPPANRSPAYTMLYGTSLSGGNVANPTTTSAYIPSAASYGQTDEFGEPLGDGYGNAAGSMFGIAAGAAIATDMAEGNRNQPKPATAAEIAAEKRTKRDDIIRGVVVGTSVSLATSLIQPIIAPMVEAVWASVINGVMGQDYWQRLKQRNRSE